MATKAKAKPKSTKKKAAPRKAAPTTNIVNHPFPPGTRAGFYPSVTVDLERRIGRAPAPKPEKTAKVRKDGTLANPGLKTGLWTAAAELEDGVWRYFNFGVS